MPEDPVQTGDERPPIDITDALGSGGHEVEQLGYEGVEDTGPVIDHHEDSELDDESALDRVAMESPPD